MEVKCPQCGFVNTGSVERCQKCGASLKDETVAFSPAAEEKISEKIQLKVKPLKRSLIVLFPEAPTETIELQQGTYTIGRSEESDLFLNDLTVSRQHAVLAVEKDGVFIEDLGSLNGTFINGKLIDKRATLNDGDVIQIGRFKLLYRVGEVGSDE